MSVSVAIIESDPDLGAHLASLVMASPELMLSGVAQTVSAAQALIARDQADVYLVNLDLTQLAQAAGVDLIGLIKSSCAQAKSLVIGSQGDAQDIVRSIRAGAKGFLLKEECTPDLANKIVALHNGVSPLSPTLVNLVFQALEEVAASQPSAAPTPDFASRFGLIPREVAVLKHLSQGLSVDAIADQLFVSPHTVNQYLRAIYRKLSVHSRSMAVHVAVQNGFLAV
jgi:DNA-binding NarL/FixJ family response regulator